MASIQRAASRRRVSASGAPTNWTPRGSPSGASPVGMEMAGRPSPEASALNTGSPVVDGSGAEAAVAGRVLAVVTERLGAPGGLARAGPD